MQSLKKERSFFIFSAKQKQIYMGFYINKEHLVNSIEYPKRFRSENLLKSVSIVSGVILLFLLSFKPFGVYDPELKMHYFFICLLHAVSPGVIIFIYFSLLNYNRSKKGKIRNWTLLKEYVQISIILFLAGLSSFFMRDLIYDNNNNWSWQYLWEEIRNAFVAGTFFYFFLRLSGFYFESKKGSPFVLQFNKLNIEPQKINNPAKIYVSTQVKQDDFSLAIDELLFVKADGNYIELTQLKGNKISKELKRISLTQFETQLSVYPHFFRCHRTYLVNMFKIEKIAGNSQGYLLSFNDTDIKIPVSRKQIDDFNNYYENLKSQYIA